MPTAPAPTNGAALVLPSPEAAAIRAALDRLATGDLSATVGLPDDTLAGELGTIAEQLNRTIASLRERDAIRALFGRYVRPAVADAMLRGEVCLTGERREVTVLMSDIRSFTVLSQTLEPEALLILVNRYFGYMVDAVVEFEGTLDKFIGDCLFVEFNAPIDQDLHALRAVLTALRMRERLAAFNRGQSAQGSVEIRTGIGIHTGEAIVGNIGSEGRKVDYTAIGDTINCTARLETQTKEANCDVVISADTFDRVAEWVDVGTPTVIRLRERAEPLVAYPLLGLKPGLELGIHLLDLARKRAGVQAPAPVASNQARAERQRLLEELDTRAAAQRATLDSVMASMSDGLLVWDNARQIRFCNDRAAAALGATRTSLISQPVQDSFSSIQHLLQAPDDVRMAWQRALASTDERPTFQVRLDGAPPRHFLAQVFPVVDEAHGGVRVGGGLVLRDVTALEAENDRKRHELERASAIQRRLLPSSIEGWPGVLEIAHRFRPAVETAGDFFDVTPLSAADDSMLFPLQIAVGDVAGKGMAAALVTALARSALRFTTALPAAATSPSGTLRLAGQRLYQDVGAEHFVACALAVVEPPGPRAPGPRLRLANAAQVPVLLVRDGICRELQPPGYRLPLGCEPDGDYEDLKLTLVPGDVVVFTSDGLVEAPALPTAAAPPHLVAATPNELFGFARLQMSASHWSTSTATAEAVAAGMWSDATAWCGEDSHHDDMTLLVLRVPA